MFPLPRGAVSWFFLFFCLLYTIESGQSSEARVVCYYTNWSVYRPGTAKFNPQNINPYLCTHLIYAFGGFTKDNTLKPFDKYQDIEQGGYAKFTGLKTYNKNLKTMLAIGGWNEASSRFSPLVANADRRQKFVKSIIKFLRQNHFDGLDLDWEYPSFRDGGKSRDRDNYAQFVQELREEFNRESSKTGRPRLLVTMAVPAGIEYIEKGYDIPKLNKYLDWFNILTYDYHSAFEPSVNHHAPLKSLEEDDEYNFDTELNIDHTVKYYLTAGADRDKLVLGIPTYGRSYTLFNSDATDIGSPADGPGEQGDATREKGYLAYYEICQNIKDDPEWTVIQPNPDVMGPYAFKDTQWVGYDDEAMARKKGVYVAENGLGGIMFWSIDNDDFRGICTGKPYPIIEAAKEALLDSLGVGDNDIIKSTHPRKPNRSRSRPGTSSDRNKITKTQEKNDIESKRRSTTTAPRGNSRRRTTTSTTTTTVKPIESSLVVHSRTTPEPPTTPDPGSDFKCEDEGFFPHPRDCKKYFWCLDSGPSNLGIVAHQFTCPSGLFFNKAADSCDYSRNVLCKIKTEEVTVKTTTTTTKSPSTTTPSSRQRVTATTRNAFFRSSTTTTTPAYEEEEYEDEDDEPLLPQRDIEDPRVIKELIDLIKKAGGLEELEKQLQFQEDGTAMLNNGKTKEISTTPATISKSLYEKVLSRASAGTFQPKNRYSSFFNRKDEKNKVDRSSEVDTETEIETEVTRQISDNKYSSVVRNSRPSPQNEGLDKLPEYEGLFKEKPKYVTIQRTRPTAIIKNEDDEDEESVHENDSDEEDDDDDVPPKNQRVHYTTESSNSQYVNIRRQRPTTVVTDRFNVDNDDEDEDDKPNINFNSNQVTTPGPQYVSISRRRPTTTSESSIPESDPTSISLTTNRYKFIERSRPTTTTSTFGIITTQKDKEEKGGEVEYSQTYSSSSSTSPASSSAAAEVISTTLAAPSETTILVPSTNNPYTITTINPDTTTRAYSNLARRTTQSQDINTTELPTHNIVHTTQTLLADTEIPDTNINLLHKISTTNEPLIETDTLIYNDNDKNEVTTINFDDIIISSLSSTEKIVTVRDTTAKIPITQTTTTTINTISDSKTNDINSISETLNNYDINNNNNNITNKNKSQESSTIGTNIQSDFTPTVLVPKPFGFSRRTRPAASTSTTPISTSSSISPENPVSPSKVSSSLSFNELNKRKYFGINRTSSSLLKTSSEVGNMSDLDDDDDVNVKISSTSDLLRPKPFSTPTTYESSSSKFIGKGQKRPLAPRFNSIPTQASIASEIHEVITSNTDGVSIISSTENNRANIIRNRGRGRFRPPVFNEEYDQVSPSSHRPQPTRRYRPNLQLLTNGEYDTSTQANIIRPLRPTLEADLSTLTAADFSRLLRVNPSRKSVRVTRPPTTRTTTTTTEEPQQNEDLEEKENSHIKRPSHNKFNIQSERKPFASRTKIHSSSEIEENDEEYKKNLSKTSSINRFSSTSLRRGRVNESSTENNSELGDSKVSSQRTNKLNFQRRPFRPAVINSLANDEVASSIGILNLEKNISNSDENFEQSNNSSQFSTLNNVSSINNTKIESFSSRIGIAGGYKRFGNFSNIETTTGDSLSQDSGIETDSPIISLKVGPILSEGSDVDGSTTEQPVRVSLGRKLIFISNADSNFPQTTINDDNVAVTEIINNIDENVTNNPNDEKLNNFKNNSLLISSNKTDSDIIRVISTNREHNTLNNTEGNQDSDSNKNLTNERRKNFSGRNLNTTEINELSESNLNITNGQNNTLKSYGKIDYSSRNLNRTANRTEIGNEFATRKNASNLNSNGRKVFTIRKFNRTEINQQSEDADNSNDDGKFVSNSNGRGAFASRGSSRNRNSTINFNTDNSEIDQSLSKNRPSAPPRRFRPNLDVFYDDDEEYETTTQVNIVRPLRPVGFESDLSSLTAADFSRGNHGNRNRMRIIRPLGTVRRTKIVKELKNDTETETEFEPEKKPESTTRTNNLRTRTRGKIGTTNNIERKTKIQIGGENDTETESEHERISTEKRPESTTRTNNARTRTRGKIEITNNLERKTKIQTEGENKIIKTERVKDIRHNSELETKKKAKIEITTEADIDSVTEVESKTETETETQSVLDIETKTDELETETEISNEIGTEKYIETVTGIESITEIATEIENLKVTETDTDIITKEKEKLDPTLKSVVTEEIVPLIYIDRAKAHDLKNSTTYLDENLGIQKVNRSRVAFIQSRRKFPLTNLTSTTESNEFEVENNSTSSPRTFGRPTRPGFSSRTSTQNVLTLKNSDDVDSVKQTNRTRTIVRGRGRSFNSRTSISTQDSNDIEQNTEIENLVSSTTRTSRRRPSFNARATTESSTIDKNEVQKEDQKTPTTRTRIAFGRQRIQRPGYNSISSTTELSENEDEDEEESVTEIEVKPRTRIAIGRQRFQRPGVKSVSSTTETGEINDEEEDSVTEIQVKPKNRGFISTTRRIRPNFGVRSTTPVNEENVTERFEQDENIDDSQTSTLRNKVTIGRQRIQRPGFNVRTKTNASEELDEKLLIETKFKPTVRSGFKSTTKRVRPNFGLRSTTLASKVNLDENESDYIDEDAITEPNIKTTTRSRVLFGNARPKIQRPGFSLRTSTTESSEFEDESSSEIDEKESTKNISRPGFNPTTKRTRPSFGIRSTTTKNEESKSDQNIISRSKVSPIGKIKRKPFNKFSKNTTESEEDLDSEVKLVTVKNISRRPFSLRTSTTPHSEESVEESDEVNEITEANIEYVTSKIFYSRPIELTTFSYSEDIDTTTYESNEDISLENDNIKEVENSGNRPLISTLSNETISSNTSTNNTQSSTFENQSSITNSTAHPRRRIILRKRIEGANKTENITTINENGILINATTDKPRRRKIIRKLLPPISQQQEIKSYANDTESNESLESVEEDQEKINKNTRIKINNLNDDSREKHFSEEDQFSDNSEEANINGKKTNNDEDEIKDEAEESKFQNRTGKFVKSSSINTLVGSNNIQKVNRTTRIRVNNLNQVKLNDEPREKHFSEEDEFSDSSEETNINGNQKIISSGFKLNRTLINQTKLSVKALNTTEENDENEKIIKPEEKGTKFNRIRPGGFKFRNHLNETNTSGLKLNATQDDGTSVDDLEEDKQSNISKGSIPKVNRIRPGGFKLRNQLKDNNLKSNNESNIDIKLEDDDELPISVDGNNKTNGTKPSRFRLNRIQLNRTSSKINETQDEFSVKTVIDFEEKDLQSDIPTNALNLRYNRNRPGGFKLRPLNQTKLSDSINGTENIDILRKNANDLDEDDKDSNDGSLKYNRIRPVGYKFNRTQISQTNVSELHSNDSHLESGEEVSGEEPEDHDEGNIKVNRIRPSGFKLNRNLFNHNETVSKSNETDHESNGKFTINIEEEVVDEEIADDGKVNRYKPGGFKLRNLTNQTKINDSINGNSTNKESSGKLNNNLNNINNVTEGGNLTTNRIRPGGFKLNRPHLNLTFSGDKQGSIATVDDLEEDGEKQGDKITITSPRPGGFNRTRLIKTSTSINATNLESVNNIKELESDENLNDDDDEQENVDTNNPVSSSTIVPKVNRLVGINRPSFKPRKPSSSEVTSSTESSSTTSKNYVRKFSSRFSLGRKPEEIVPNDDSFYDPKSIGIKPLIKPVRPFSSIRNNAEEDEYSEERYSDEEYNDEESEEEVAKPVNRPSVLNLLNRNRFVPSSQKNVEQEEEEESEEEKPNSNARPIFQGFNRYNPNRFRTPEQENDSNYESEEANEEVNNKNNNNNYKSETVRPIIRYTTPPRLPQPRPSFRTIGSATTTIHPASLRFKTTPTIDTTTQSIRELELIKLRNYERKYSSQSTTDINNVQPNLLEELDVDAINARNKKIFNEHKKFTTTTTPSTTTQRINYNNITDESNIIDKQIDSLTIIPDITIDEQYETTTTDDNTIITTIIDSDELNTSTQKMELINDTIDDKELLNTNILQESSGTTTDVSNITSSLNVSTSSLTSSLTALKHRRLKLTTTTQKPTTLHHIFAIDEDSSIDNIRDKLQSSGESSEQISKKLEKLVEINRIVEVYSKQQKTKNKNNQTESIEDDDNQETFNWVLEKVPTLDKLGEISRIILIRLQNHNTTEEELEEKHTGYENIDKFLSTININNKTQRNNITTVTNVSSKNQNKSYIIDSKSSIADYSPTEYPSTSPLIPVRNSIPGNTKNINEEVTTENYPTTDTSTIRSNLEAIVLPKEQHKNVGRVNIVNVIPLDGKKPKNVYYPEMINSVETSTIPLEGLFHRERETKQSSDDPSVDAIYTTTTSSPVYYHHDTEPETQSSPLLSSSGISGLLDIITPPTTTTINNEILSTTTEKTTTSPVYISNPQYVRPLAPFLRPESNESSPLVISIANLDQVILSKVAAKKSDKTIFFNHPETAELNRKNIAKTNNLKLDSQNDNLKPAVITDSDINSEELRTLKKRAKNIVDDGGDDNDELSLLTNLNKDDDSFITTTSTTTTLPPSTDSPKIQERKPAKIRPQYRPNFRRPAVNSNNNNNNNNNSSIKNNRVRGTTTQSPSSTKGTDTTDSFNNNSISSFKRRTRPTKSSSSSSSVTTTPPTVRPTSKLVVRRKYTPRPTITPTFGGGGERRKKLTTTTTAGTPTKIPDVGDATSEPQRTVNPLFRRKFTFTTRRPTIQTTTQQAAAADFELASPITTITPIFDIISNDDQEADTSIVQDNKFLNSRFNQIGETIDDDVAEALQAISKAPLPYSASLSSPTTSKYFQSNTNNYNNYNDNTNVQYERPTTQRVEFLTPRKRLVTRRPIYTTTTPVPTTPANVQQPLRRRKPQPFERIKTPKSEFPGRTYRPVIDYDYYDDGDTRIVPKSSAQVKVVLHGRGIIECLDQGNFPHPLSCRKFISCAKMETGGVVGWEYTCPKGLSYDPVGGICNWSAGLGCNE